MVSEQNQEDGMSQNVPKCPTPEETKSRIDQIEADLKPKQIKALDRIVNLGLSNQEIADELDLSRKTITRWRNHNEQFQTALRYRLKANRQESMDRLQSLTNDLVDVVVDHVQSMKLNADSDETFQSAIKFLQKTGLFEVMDQSADPSEEVDHTKERYYLGDAFPGGDPTIQQLEDLRRFMEGFVGLDQSERQRVFETLAEVSELSAENAALNPAEED